MSKETKRCDCGGNIKQFLSAIKDEIEYTQNKCDKCFVYWRSTKSLITNVTSWIKLDETNGTTAEIKQLIKNDDK